MKAMCMALVVCCVVFVMAVAVPDNVQAAEGFNADLVRVTFDVFGEEITITELESLLWTDMLGLKIELLSIETGLHPTDDLNMTWTRNHEYVMTWKSTLSYSGINPTNPDMLVFRPNNSPSPAFEGMAYDGEWRMRVYIAGQFMGESAPIMVSVLPAPFINFDEITVDFYIPSTLVYLAQEASSFDTGMYCTIRLSSANTGLTSGMLVHFGWAQDGGESFFSTRAPLSGFDIDPTNVNMLTSFDVRINMTHFAVNMYTAGDWTLRIYIAGQLIGESDPLTLRVITPGPFDDIWPAQRFRSATGTNRRIFSDIAYVYQRGIMSGTGYRRFAPDTTVTRAMVAQMLFNMHENAYITTPNTSFTDVATGRWYTNAVVWAYQNGLVSGFGDGTFRPNDYISRRHLTLLLNNYASFAGVNPPTLQLDVPGYALRGELAALLNNFLVDARN